MKDEGTLREAVDDCLSSFCPGEDRADPDEDCADPDLLPTFNLALIHPSSVKFEYLG
jgi:hypothetical protein